MRKTCSSSSTEWIREFSFRALSTSVPNGFSMITFEPAASFASPRPRTMSGKTLGGTAQKISLWEVPS